MAITDGASTILYQFFNIEREAVAQKMVQHYRRDVPNNEGLKREREQKVEAMIKLVAKITVEKPRKGMTAGVVAEPRASISQTLN